jgi:hypothetical protein
LGRGESLYGQSRHGAEFPNPVVEYIPGVELSVGELNVDFGKFLGDGLDLCDQVVGFIAQVVPHFLHPLAIQLGVKGHRLIRFF